MKLNEFEFVYRLRNIVADLNFLLLPNPPGKESVETEKIRKIRDELESLLKLVKPEYGLSDLLSDMPFILDYIRQSCQLPQSAATAVLAKTNRKNESEGR